MTSSPTPRRLPRTAAQLAAEPSHRGLYEPGWVTERRRRERADAITAYRYHLAHRARAARTSLALDGYHIGAAPYGYRTLPATTSPAWGEPPSDTGPDNGAGADRARRWRLVVDPATGHVVWLIFWWRITDRLGYSAIARTLAQRPQAYPAPVHPRTAARQPWTATRVRTILANPRYTGRQVVPIRPVPAPVDPTASGAFASSALTDGAFTDWLRPRRWIASAPAHQALISDEMFRAAQHLAGPTTPLWLYGPTPTQADTHPSTEPAGLTEPAEHPTRRDGDWVTDCGTDGDEWRASA